MSDAIQNVQFVPSDVEDIPDIEEVIVCPNQLELKTAEGGATIDLG